MRAGVPLPLVGLPATVAPEVRIDSLEPYVTDAMEPRIVFNPALTQLLAELDSWPEKQSGHHYDGLSALWLLWVIAVARGGGHQLQTVARKGAPSASRGGRGGDDDYPQPESRRM
jgi:hypothetical protein